MKHIKDKYYDYYLDEKERYQGEYKSYHKNGKLWIHKHYKDGKEHGEYKSYHDDGQLEYHTYYENDIDKGIEYLRNKKIEAILK